MLLSLALIIAFVSFMFNWKVDQSALGHFADRSVEAENWLSKFGAAISSFFMYRGFGIAAFSLAVLTGLSGIYLFFDLRKKNLLKYWTWGLIVMIWFSTALGFFAEKNVLLGGMIGFETNDFLQDYIGFAGTLLLLAFVAIIYLVVRLNITPELVSTYFHKTKKEVSDEFETAKAEVSRQKAKMAKQQVETESASVPTPPPHDDDVSFEGSMTAKQATDKPDKTEKSSEEKTTADAIDLTTAPSTQEPTSTSGKQAGKKKVVIESNASESDFSMEVETAEEEEVEANTSKKMVEDFGEFDPTLELSNYKFPSVNLLKDYQSGGGGITINQEELEENKDNIVNTLNNYKIGISQIKATVGPTVTLYEIVPEAGVRISKIRNLEDDIALSLAALGIRIIAPIPGRGTIGIEVPNKNPSIVSMRSVIASSKFQNAEMQLPVALGKTISNETFVVDLAKMPHLLMAGATGQGKSVGLNAILTSLLYQKHPAEIKFVLFDPKKVELTLFNKI